MLKITKENFKKREFVFSENLIVPGIAGHTAPVAHIKDVSNGVATAEWYFVSRYFDLIDDNKAVATVNELKKLQITDENNYFYGCVRWYREEEFISDSNGAFFVLRPLALAYKLCYDKLTASEKETIKEMLEKSIKWFVKETTATNFSTIHYSNKIMSDGAMLSLINSICRSCAEECHNFWNKWNEYVDRRGYGWGENTSDCYSSIMLAALNMVIISSDDVEVLKIAEEKRKNLLSYIIFHEGKEFVPSVRTYNFSGSITYGGGIYKFLYRDCNNTSDKSNVNMSALNNILLFEANTNKLELSRENTRCERIFDDSFAYTWKGKNIRLGTVTKFPAMQGCYQRDGWGLGWQSMPVSVMIEDAQVLFMRIRTRVNGKEHSHPAVNKHDAYLYGRLFEDGNRVVFNTVSKQEKNIAVVVRSANLIANTAEAIYDEWCIPKGAGEICELDINNRKWFVVMYPENAVALCPLDGINALDPNRQKSVSNVGESGSFNVISTELYKGENKLLFSPRIESAWAVVALESSDNIEEYLKTITIEDDNIFNLENPEECCMCKRKIVCTDEEIKVELAVNPYYDLFF